MSVFYSSPKKYSLRLSVLLVFSMFGQFGHVAAQLPKKSHERSSLKSNLINIEAAASDAFRYNATLYNGTTETKIYQLQAQIPSGWWVAFSTAGSQVTSVQVEAGKSQDISIELHARPDSKPSKYNIPVSGIAAGDTLKLGLEAVLKGSYGIELTTPSGRLSDDVTEGSSKEVLMVVRNKATLTLENVEMSAQNPANWEVAFEPSRIERLEPGQSADIKVTIKVPDKTISGDYLTTVSAKNTNANADASFRMTVKTSLLSGWIGILVILLAVSIVYYLIRKYGRR
jgi:uncharacterized membrane protein